MFNLFKNKKKLHNCFKTNTIKNDSTKVNYLTKKEKIESANKINEIKTQVNNYFNNRCM